MTLKITISIGIAFYDKEQTVPDLMTKADEALYRAKRDGRNRVNASLKPGGL